MPDTTPNGQNRGTNGLFEVPNRAPHYLEWLAAAWLGAEANDIRLGDLSEQYVRRHERMRSRLGDTPWATAVSCVAAGAQYVFTAAVVMLFARTVDPGVRLVEGGAAWLVALELRERSMSMLRFSAQRLVVPAMLLVCSALLVNSAAGIWSSWRQNEALMVSLQRDKAETAAQRIAAFLRDVESQVSWVAYAQFAKLPVEQRRFDYVRLLQQVPTITALTQLDGDGNEQLAVSRLAMDVVGSGVNRSVDPAFVETKSKRIYYGPLSFRRNSEPYMTLAIANGRGSGVTVAEVNLKPVWDIIQAVQVGDNGYGYVVDGKGRPIGHRDVTLPLRQSDLSALPQVAAALSGSPTMAALEGKGFDAAGATTASVRSISAAVPAPGWHVFVDWPAAELQAALWRAVAQSAVLLGLGIMAALLAIRIALRPITSARPASA